MPWAHAQYHTVISIAVGSLSHRWFGAVGGLSGLRDGVSSAHAEEAAVARADRKELQCTALGYRSSHISTRTSTHYFNLPVATEGHNKCTQYFSPVKCAAYVLDIVLPGVDFCK